MLDVNVKWTDAFLNESIVNKVEPEKDRVWKLPKDQICLF